VVRRPTFCSASAPTEESAEPAAVVIPTGPIEYLDLSPFLYASAILCTGVQRYLQASLRNVLATPGALEAGLSEHKMPIIRTTY